VRLQTNILSYLLSISYPIFFTFQVKNYPLRRFKVRFCCYSYGACLDVFKARVGLVINKVRLRWFEHLAYSAMSRVVTITSFHFLMHFSRQSFVANSLLAVAMNLLAVSDIWLLKSYFLV